MDVLILLSFTIASMWLCFGFVLRTAQPVDNPVMFLLWVSSIKAFSASYLTPTRSGLVVHKELGGNTAGIPTNPRDITQHMTLCSAIKLVEKVGG